MLRACSTRRRTAPVRGSIRCSHSLVTGTCIGKEMGEDLLPMTAQSRAAHGRSQPPLVQGVCEQAWQIDPRAAPSRYHPATRVLTCEKSPWSIESQLPRIPSLLLPLASRCTASGSHPELQRTTSPLSGSS